MPSTNMLPGGRPRAVPRRNSEVLRAMLVGVALTGVFAAAYAIGTGWQTPSMRETAFARSSQVNDDDLTTGSIVFVPLLGNTCRKNLIDNRTWRVRESGTVPCDQALAESRHRGSGGGATSRLDVIRESFRKSPR